MIKVFEDHEGLSRAAAELFVREARRAVQEKRRDFSVCLSGGETPRRAYQLLAEKPLRSHTPWHGVQVFFADERVVSHEDPRSNYRTACDALFDHVPVASEQIHAIPVAGAPEECAAWYEALLQSYFSGRRPRFDLVLLGLGRDGHTASLFPGSAAAGERNRWVAPVLEEGLELSRVTLTSPIINEAARVVFLVSGRDKADILKEVLEEKGADAGGLPARGIKPGRGELLWLVDRDAARLLQ